MRHLLPLLLVLPLGVGGCMKKLPKIPKDMLPAASFEQMKVNSFDWNGLESTFVFNVNNPYPLGLELESLNWKLGLQGQPFLDGAKGKAISIEAGGDSTVRIPVGMAFADILGLVTEARDRDEVAWDLTGDFSFATPVGPVTLPFSEQGMLPVLHVPKVSLQGVRVTGFSPTKASLAVDVGIETTQASPLQFNAFDYSLKLAGTRVASGKAEVTPIEGAGTLTLPVDLKLLELGAEIVSAVTNKGKLKVDLNGDAELQTVLGPLPLSLDHTAQLKLN